MRECKRQGCYVMLLTVERLAGYQWPRESIDELFLMPDFSDREALLNAVSYLARSRPIDRIAAMDDYDVEVAASLREHLRCPGMGETTARLFRDKLAMRVQARDQGILVPPFVPVLNYAALSSYMEAVPPPWVLKPRSEASAVGIRKINEPEELWPVLDSLGDRQSHFLLEKYVPGDVFHVDAITYNGKILFAEYHKYGSPPFDVAHYGGIFSSITLPSGPDKEALAELHGRVLEELNFVRGVTHTEFIKGYDGRFYFLETAARVGGAYLFELVQASSGLNLWAEWARIEIAGGEAPYAPEPTRDLPAGLIISLARQEHPDTSAYNDPEITWKLDEHSHAGLIVVSEDIRRVEELIADYTERFMADFYAMQPALDKPSS